MVTGVTGRDVMSGVQKIETLVLYVIVGINMRRNARPVLVECGSLAVTVLLTAHYDSLFAERPNSIKVARYGRVVKPVHKEETI